MFTNRTIVFLSSVIVVIFLVVFYAILKYADNSNGSVIKTPDVSSSKLMPNGFEALYLSMNIEVFLKLRPSVRPVKNDEFFVGEELKEVLDLGDFSTVSYVFTPETPPLFYGGPGDLLATVSFEIQEPIGENLKIRDALRRSILKYGDGFKRYYNRHRALDEATLVWKIGKSFVTVRIWHHHSKKDVLLLCWSIADSDNRYWGYSATIEDYKDEQIKVNRVFAPYQDTIDKAVKDYKLKNSARRAETRGVIKPTEIQGLHGE